MYYGRKKGIIIAIIIIVVLLLLAIGGIFLYLNTDLFKSNETLFLKYIEQAAKSMEYTPNTQLQDILKEENQTPYTLTGKMNLQYEGEEEDSVEFLKQLQLIINANVNKPEEKSYAKATIKYKNQDLFNVEYANSNNIYALKSDEIVTAFVGVRNDNLKVLAQKLGITDTSAIPNSIEPIDYNEILTITDEEKGHIADTYLPVIVEAIPKQNYTKQTNIPVTKDGVSYNTTAYRLDLTSEEVANIGIKILETLKQDSITLNLITTKAKLLNLSEEYTQINNLTELIQEQIDDIESATKSPESGLNIVVYAEKGQTVLTEIIIKNEAKITMYGAKENETNNIYAIIENLSTDDDYTTIEVQLSETKTLTESNMQLLVNKDDTTGIEIYIDNASELEQGSTTSNCQVVLNKDEDTKITVDYKQEIVFGDEDNEIITLDNTNCAVLNDYPTEQLTMLIQLIAQQTTNVLNQKIEQLGLQTNQNQTNNIINEVDSNTNNVAEQENEISQNTQI